MKVYITDVGCFKNASIVKDALARKAKIYVEDGRLGIEEAPKFTHWLDNLSLHPDDIVALADGCFIYKITDRDNQIVFLTTAVKGRQEFKRQVEYNNRIFR